MRSRRRPEGAFVATGVVTAAAGVVVLAASVVGAGNSGKLMMSSVILISMTVMRQFLIQKMYTLDIETMLILREKVSSKICKEKSQCCQMTEISAEKQKSGCWPHKNLSARKNPEFLQIFLKNGRKGAELF
jgi:ABC-type transport system involved in cytochrome bd biosynthesis fused ATPase/permease subunit